MSLAALVAALIWWGHRSNGFADLGFVWVLCVFCSETWIDFYLLGSDGLDVAVIWWFFFFFFPLICDFGSSGILVGSGHGGGGRHGGGGVVMTGLFGC